MARHSPRIGSDDTSRITSDFPQRDIWVVSEMSGMRVLGRTCFSRSDSMAFGLVSGRESGHNTQYAPLAPWSFHCGAIHSSENRF